jgi:NADPH:quinone reductase-like Zn-dependent oxidoreductase
LKAAVYREYGPPDVLRIVDIEKPVPKDNEVLVRIHVTTVCAADWRLRKADPFLIRFMSGLTRPKNTILGMEFAGSIAEVGRNVTRFTPGDAVFGATGFNFGCYTEYIALPADHKYLTKKPPGLADEEVAAIPFGGITALHFLRKGNVGPGQKVLVYGASGSVGTAGVQLARHFGAHVTGVCSTANLELVKSIGADAVVDYTRDDFTKAGRVYDVVLETVGKTKFRDLMKVLKRGGALLQVAPGPGALFGGLGASMTGRAKAIGGVARSEPGDLEFMAGLVADGKMKTVIDRRYRLDEIAEAHRHAEAGHKKGNVVVLVA